MISIIFLGQLLVVQKWSKKTPQKDQPLPAILTRWSKRVTGPRNSSNRYSLSVVRLTLNVFLCNLLLSSKKHVNCCALARRMLQIRPDLPIILCTGYSCQISEEKAKSYGIKGFAMKPLTRKDIAALVRKILDAEKSNL